MTQRHKDAFQGEVGYVLGADGHGDVFVGGRTLLDMLRAMGYKPVNVAKHAVVKVEIEVLAPSEEFG